MNHILFVCFGTIHKLLQFIRATRHPWTDPNAKACIGPSAVMVEKASKNHFWALLLPNYSSQLSSNMKLFAKLIITIIQQDDEVLKVSIITYIALGRR